MYFWIFTKEPFSNYVLDDLDRLLMPQNSFFDVSTSLSCGLEVVVPLKQAFAALSNTHAADKALAIHVHATHKSIQKGGASQRTGWVTYFVSMETENKKAFKYRKDVRKIQPMTLKLLSTNEDSESSFVELLSF